MYSMPCVSVPGNTTLSCPTPVETQPEATIKLIGELPVTTSPVDALPLMESCPVGPFTAATHGSPFGASVYSR